MSWPLNLFTEQSMIIAYIDMLLVNAIESCPHTKSQEQNIQSVLKYSEHLRRQPESEDESNDREAE